MPSHRYIDETSNINPRNHHQMIDVNKNHPLTSRTERPTITPPEQHFEYRSEPDPELP